ncbi:uncharacterized protein LOC114944728 [Nylanderia fulva]|uniref:uncharacterized protein LOC114944728 n=1 Tax=Nylanderia fulva TaxID=613905 RepID=UPI0010FB6089|nr:uncharacterized protein LOC114944728 [Nylanderia fulva]
MSLIYDPLGLLGPIIVQGKILMQYLWQSKCKWDEGVTTEIKDMWLQWKSQIGSVEQLTIPRRMLCDNPEEIEVHGFCDASEKAYGACLYFRTTNSRENYTVRLVCAKSRIAPIKRVSLPRLELCSAVLLANLVRNVLQSLTIQIHKVYYWTDSTIVLAWIAREPTHWKTFVANRVAEIQRETKNAQWYHVRSEDNPADLLSREVSPAKLKEKRIWWEGPQFLQHNSVFVPFSAENIYEDITEKRTTNLLVLKEANEYMAIIERFSSLSRLKRVTAYCLRLAKRSVQNTSQQSKLLTVLKLEHAMKTLIKGCQAHSFAEELHNLSNKKRLQSKSKLLTLNPFLDEEGIIRVGGRLCNATIEYSQKHPIILPSKHHLTTLIIRDAHYKNLHAGSQAILMMVRNNYWPISGREADYKHFVDKAQSQSNSLIMEQLFMQREQMAQQQRILLQMSYQQILIQQFFTAMHINQGIPQNQSYLSNNMGLSFNQDPEPQSINRIPDISSATTGQAVKFLSSQIFTFRDETDDEDIENCIEKIKNVAEVHNLSPVVMLATYPHPN